MIPNLKMPLLILSTARSGSTALAYALAKQYGVPCFNEPGCHPSLQNYQSNLEKATLSVRSGQPHIIKVHEILLRTFLSVLPVNLSTYDVITIRRRDLVDQITSMYISMMTTRWHEISHREAETVNIDDTIMGEAIKIGNNIDSRLANAKTRYPWLKISHELFYEDLDFSSANYIHTIRPSNYAVIHDMIRSKITETP